MERGLFPTTWIGQAMERVMPDLHVHIKHPRKPVSHGLRQPPWCPFHVLSELPPEQAELGCSTPGLPAGNCLFCSVTLKNWLAFRSVTDNFAISSWKLLLCSQILNRNQLQRDLAASAHVSVN